MIIQSRSSCKAKQDEARDARDQMKKAMVYFDEVETNLTNAKLVMDQVRHGFENSEFVY